ncbi:sugar transferase [Paenibacillus alginolyticus]|uniref:Sugar transferase n=1 Tax=Paenibacillus alginolyticus TaxID=59839 RepID=A0ABT4G8Q2_9BACL|nr:sugar transferase [Paenibacillus alginolyticus]MCY9692567.1 sugar transferase [Paenibacillus alginolyticus]MEC0143773.1 sugar transferase [Paenibacillus alginolyticus]
MKRLFDIVFSFIALIILIPICLVIAAAIFLENGGPLVFKQKRMGVNNQLFTIYKFRTMRKDTPNVPTHLLSDPDKYITKIGKLLRKTSLDELPQVLNIIKGDMSLVGPRPALYNQTELIQMRQENGIDKVRPGLTGWAQINGRDDITDALKVRYDLEYVQKCSMRFDIEIIVKTVLAVIKAKNIKA